MSLGELFLSGFILPLNLTGWKAQGKRQSGKDFPTSSGTVSSWAGGGWGQVLKLAFGLPSLCLSKTPGQHSLLYLPETDMDGSSFRCSPVPGRVLDPSRPRSYGLCMVGRGPPTPPCALQALTALWGLPISSEAIARPELPTSVLLCPLLPLRSLTEWSQSSKGTEP